jgi:hypothetical protein
MLQNLNLCSVRAESVELSSVKNRLLQTNPPKFKLETPLEGAVLVWMQGKKRGASGSCMCKP